MLTKFLDQASSVLLPAGQGRKLIILAFYALFLIPILILAAFSYLLSYRDLTEFTLSRRQTIAYLAATTTKEKLDRLSDIAVSLATRVRFRQMVSDGRWEEAVAILASVPRDFPFIDRVFLTDPEGVLTADAPELPGVRGRNFAFRDWYQGVNADGRPYVSEVYKRSAEPRLNVVAIAVPIKGQDETLAGILVLQIRLSVLLDWIQTIEVGPQGFLFVVDRKGQIVAHPKLPLEEGIVDFAGIPAVQKALRGERGVEIFFDAAGHGKLAAYQPVPGYGWGVIAEQPREAAFAVRNRHLWRILAAYGLLGLFSAALAYGILRALAQRRQTEDAILKLNRELRGRAGELENANKELEAFSYSISHDLRAPLRAIDGFSRILTEKHAAELPDEARRYLSRVRDNAKQMGHLIDDLLAFSRLSRQPLKTQAVSPADLVRQVLAEQGQQDASPSPAEVSVGELPPCRADPSLLKQVYSNLLANAVKFTRHRAGARIEVGCQNGGAETVYFVRDNGVGFDMRYADKLFGVFQRLHRAEEYEGTGVGLAIVQRIIHRHGGRVWVEAGVDQGATFYFTLGGGAANEQRTDRDSAG
jgi:signal transduction histidine kinase